MKSVILLTLTVFALFHNCKGQCSSPPSIANGSPGTPTSLNVGGIVTYSCNTGYQLSGSANVTCSNYDIYYYWTLIPSCTVVFCGYPSVLNGSPETPITNTTFGATVTYSCNTGYQQSGPSVVICQASGDWSVRPNCTVISCGPPLLISNGSPGTAVSITFGGTVTYSCNIGYELSGLSRVTCQSNGNWSTRPSCAAVSCGPPFSITNGSPGTPTSTTFGGTVTYSCDTGYQLSGPVTVTCQASRNWSTVPTCTIVSCGPPSSISNGSPGTPNSTVFEGTVTYSCDIGYQLSGSATATCEASGTWSISPICTVTPEAIRAEILPLLASTPIYSNSYSLSCVVHEAESFQPSLTYQWLKDDQHLESASDYFTSTLSFDALGLSDVGKYSCEVTVTSPLWHGSVRVSSDSFNLSFSVLFIQLRFNGIHLCQQYTSIESSQKTADITRGLVDGIANVCSCGFNSSFISNSFLKCFEDSPHHVTFRAILSESAHLSTVESLLSIEKWTNSTQSLIVRNVHLNFNLSCPVLITSSDSSECPIKDTTPHAETADFTATIVGVVMAMVFVVVVVLVLIITIVIVAKKYRKNGVSLESTTAEERNGKDVSSVDGIKQTLTRKPYNREMVHYPQSQPAAEYETPMSLPEYEEVGFSNVNKKAGENAYNMESCSAYN